VKPNLIFAAILLIFFSYGCSQPVGTSTSLLTSESSNPDDDDTSTDTGSSDGQLDMLPESEELTVNIDDSDRVEITGKCVDLDRRKNRILVEVFAGEDETATPYISNSISDFCQTSDAGIPIGQSCFWVTKGIGIVEPAPVNRSFPQCHNGEFGFSVRLGKALLVAGNPNQKYTVRMKLRTLDGILADSTWKRVLVTRGLNNPSIDKVSANDLAYTCTIESSPARFNPLIGYSMARQATDRSGVIAAAGTVFVNEYSDDLVTGLNVYNYLDGRKIAGVTYTYTLTAEDQTGWAPGYVLPRPTAVSNSLTCSIAKPQIFMSSEPTNAPAGTGPTCYLAPSGARANNGAGVSKQWGYALTAGWTGANSDTAGGGAGVPPGCGNSPNCTAVGLAAGVQYYFAYREIDTILGLTGKWSNEVACTPPQL
jgi:hypothetical protein